MKETKAAQTRPKDRPESTAPHISTIELVEPEVTQGLLGGWRPNGRDHTSPSMDEVDSHVDTL